MLEIQGLLLLGSSVVLLLVVLLQLRNISQLKAEAARRDEAIRLARKNHKRIPAA